MPEISKYALKKRVQHKREQVLEFGLPRWQLDSELTKIERQYPGNRMTALALQLNLLDRLLHHQPSQLESDRDRG